MNPKGGKQQVSFSLTSCLAFNGSLKISQCWELNSLKHCQSGQTALSLIHLSRAHYFKKSVLLPACTLAEGSLVLMFFLDSGGFLLTRLTSRSHFCNLFQTLDMYFDQVLHTYRHRDEIWGFLKRVFFSQVSSQSWINGQLLEICAT